MSTNRDDLIERALRFMSSEHNNAVRLRDQMYATQRRAMDNGLLSEALHAGTLIASIEGRIEGLSMGTVQLQMVRDDERIEP
jgi:hypothetical protein